MASGLGTLAGRKACRGARARRAPTSRVSRLSDTRNGPEAPAKRDASVRIKKAAAVTEVTNTRTTLCVLGKTRHRRGNRGFLYQKFFHGAIFQGAASEEAATGSRAPVKASSIAVAKGGSGIISPSGVAKATVTCRVGGFTAASTGAAPATQQGEANIAGTTPGGASVGHDAPNGEEVAPND